MGYYDIDDILAEEMLIPCTTMFPFATLSYLDENSPNSSHNTKKRKVNHNFLEKDTFLNLPLWSMKRWSELNYVRVHIPKQYGRRTRERLMADPANADIRNRIASAGNINGALYYTAGIKFCSFIERCVKLNNGVKNRKSLSTLSRATFTELEREVRNLRVTLLRLYTGARLRRCLDWSLSSIGQDVSHYTRTLTDCELKLFYAGLEATKARHEWKAFGSKKIPVSRIMMRWNHMKRISESPSNTSSLEEDRTPRFVSPDNTQALKGF